jgi:hypothetical protein
MSLASRESRFGEMVSRFETRRPCALIAVHRPPAPLLERLRIAASVYIAACLPDPARVTPGLLSDENALLAEMERQREAIPNITPNGMVVPKREVTLEYNLFVAAFAGLMDSLEIDGFIESWVHPPNLRVKEGAADARKLERPYASERRHTEAWIEMNTTRCVSVFVPLLGDTEGNRVEFFAPGPDFDEAWLRPLASYENGEPIASRYDPVDVGYEKGLLYLADAATMHQSHRRPGAGPRASIDVNFLLRAPRSTTSFARRHCPTPRDLTAIGRTRLFVPTDSMHEQIDTLGGRRHPTDRHRVVDLGGPARASAPVPLRRGPRRFDTPR